MKQSNLGTIPAGLHRQIKIRAAEAGMTIKDWIIAALKEAASKLPLPPDEQHP